MFPSDFPEVQAYPALRRMLILQVDMLIDDLRTLLQLPTGDLAGCNLTTGTVLLNLIAGASVCFYNASLAEFTNRANRGARFREVLQHYYPWPGEAPAGVDGSQVLYERARNPLTHSLGLEDPSGLPPGRLRELFLLKDAVAPRDVELLEDSPTRPIEFGPTIQRAYVSAGVRDEWYISVPTLYWGTHRMLRNLFSDPAQAIHANQLAQQLTSRL